MLDRIELQGTFDKHFSGGAICHLNLDQEIKDVKVMENLIAEAKATLAKAQEIEL